MGDEGDTTGIPSFELSYQVEMDPYDVLGIQTGASLDEVKFAFRREASKWHPDKVGDALQARQNFQELNQAYQTLTRQLRKKNAASDSTIRGSEIDNLDDVVKQTLLDYAVSLARTGMVHEDIEAELHRQGYDRVLAASLSDQALEYRRNFPSSPSEHLNASRLGSVFKKDKIDDRLTQAFLGADYPFTGNRKDRRRINYYQDVFRDLYLAEVNGSRFPLSRNRQLWKLLFRSVLLLALLLSVIFYFPWVEEFIPLSEFDMLQLPNAVLSLTLVWAFHKRLWEFALLALVVVAATQMLFYYQMPTALSQGVSDILMVEAGLVLPFFFLMFFGNFFYFQKARSTIEQVCLENDDAADRCYHTKKQGSPSSPWAWLGFLMVCAYFLHMIPQHSSLPGKLEWLVSREDSHGQSKDILEVKKQISDTGEVFQRAEGFYHSQRPDYQQAAVGYAEAARYGSLLAAYKLGYMYLHGIGVEQSDEQARSYFKQAVNASLSSQPHDLSLTTTWLAEAYNGLGVMQLVGQDMAPDSARARESFQLADKFGSGHGRVIWQRWRGLTRSELIRLLAEPIFK